MDPEDAELAIRFSVDGGIQSQQELEPHTEYKPPHSQPYDTRAISPWSLPDHKPLTPSLCQSISVRRSKLKADTPGAITLVRKWQPVSKPQGQGPFKRAWAQSNPALPTPAQILDSRPCTGQLYGNSHNRYGSRLVSTPGFGRYAARDSCWMGACADTPGPGAYMSRRLVVATESGGRTSSAGLPFAANNWSRSKRVPPVSGDKHLHTEFYAATSCSANRKAAPEYSLSGTPAANPRLAGPGPGVYYPSLDGSRPGTGHPRSFTKATKIAGISPQIRSACNAGPKYQVAMPLGTGYPQSQCTFAKADRQLDVPIQELVGG